MTPISTPTGASVPTRTPARRTTSSKAKNATPKPGMMISVHVTIRTVSGAGSARTGQLSLFPSLLTPIVCPIPKPSNLYAMVADDPESFADLDGQFGQWRGWYPSTLPNAWRQKVEASRQVRRISRQACTVVIMGIPIPVLKTNASVQAALRRKSRAKLKPSKIRAKQQRRQIPAHPATP